MASMVNGSSNKHETKNESSLLQQVLKPIETYPFLDIFQQIEAELIA